MMKNVEQIKQALREISSCYQDSRERGNCKVPEDALKRWHQMLDETLLEVGAVIDTPLLARLRNEVLMSKMTHNFTLTRDEVIELMGGKFYVLVKWANARESTSENTEESSKKPDEAQTHWKYPEEDYSAMLRRCDVAYYGEGTRTGEMLREVADLLDTINPGRDKKIKDAVFLVLSEFTLPSDVRKILETAFYG
jgi:hypothetical protein